LHRQRNKQQKEKTVSAPAHDSREAHCAGATDPPMKATVAAGTSPTVVI
jgi:hypothetical protein